MAEQPIEESPGTGRRARKFPLTLHRTGQYCKKIRGKMYYFGKDKQQALLQYYKQSSSLHTGQGRSGMPNATTLTLMYLCNLYLDHQNGQVVAGEIKYSHFYGLQLRLSAFVRHLGAARLVGDITTMEVQQYRSKLIADGMAANTINNHLRSIKAMFNWALDNEILDRSPKLKAVKAMKTRKMERQTFTPEEIRKLIETASPQMRAMILLGLNCGFGRTDCAELRWDSLNLETGRVSFPRGKTGVDRNFILWPETVDALRSVPVQGELVFYTKHGNPWVHRTKGASVHDPLSREFCKLMRKAGVEAREGTGFYTLRRTAATIAAETGDVFAVQGILGHADLKMASTYVQNTTPQTDRAITHTRKWLNQTVRDEGSSE